MDTSLANIVSKFEGYIFMGGLGKNSSVTCGYFAKVWRNSQSKVNFSSQNIQVTHEFFPKTPVNI